MTERAIFFPTAIVGAKQASQEALKEQSSRLSVQNKNSVWLFYEVIG
jgi:hypothetical protein